MTKDELLKITQTIEGYPIKDLRWRSQDNIIVGLVKDPLWGNPELHDGYIGGQWRKNGLPTNKIKGRNDLKLKI